MLGQVTGFKLLTSWGSSLLLVLNSVYVRASWGAFLERSAVEELFKEKLQRSWIRLRAMQKTKWDRLTLSLTLKSWPCNKTVTEPPAVPSTLLMLRRDCAVSRDRTVVSAWLHGKRHPLPKPGLVQFMCGESFSAEVLIIPSRQSN